MPRTTKFDRKAAVSFNLVHRSADDPLAVDGDASQAVLVPQANANQERRAARDYERASGVSGASRLSAYSTSEGTYFGETPAAADAAEPADGAPGALEHRGEFYEPGDAADADAALSLFPDDGYDYEQHLRPMGRGDGVFVPRSLLPSERLEAQPLQLRDFIQPGTLASGADLEVLMALNNEDFDENDDELEDDFVALANRTPSPSDEPRGPQHVHPHAYRDQDDDLDFDDDGDGGGDGNDDDDDSFEGLPGIPTGEPTRAQRAAAAAAAAAEAAAPGTGRSQTAARRAAAAAVRDRDLNDVTSFMTQQTHTGHLSVIDERFDKLALEYESDDDEEVTMERARGTATLADFDDVLDEFLAKQQPIRSFDLAVANSGDMAVRLGERRAEPRRYGDETDAPLRMTSEERARLHAVLTERPMPTRIDRMINELFPSTEPTLYDEAAAPDDDDAADDDGAAGDEAADAPGERSAAAAPRRRPDEATDYVVIDRIRKGEVPDAETVWAGNARVERRTEVLDIPRSAKPTSAPVTELADAATPSGMTLATAAVRPKLETAAGSGGSDDDAAADDDADDDSDVEGDDDAERPNLGEKRNRKETPDEKRARKAALKAERRDRRAQKKELRMAYKAEEARQKRKAVGTAAGSVYVMH